MLSMTRVSAGQADTYYTADDYYLQEVGAWQGELANKLGLIGVIKQDDFKSLIQGTDPNGKFQVSSGGKEHVHTAGVDLTFSAPKSVSIMGLVANDIKIIEAHDKAVKTTLDYIEKNYTNVRIKENGGVSSQSTSNMIAAKFQHISSRELDPQLHTHCLVLNMTQKENGDIRAMDYKEVYDRKMFLGQMYRNELAMNLKEFGYGIQVENKGLFEIDGVPKDLMQAFSTRSEQIKQRVQELKEKFPNVGNAELKAMATLDTRKVKDEPSVDALKESWDKLVQEHGFSKAELNELTHQPINDNKINKTDINIVLQQAISIATEHEAVANKDDILRIASKLSVGDFRLSDLESGFNEQSNLVKLDDKLYTTPQIIQMERGIVETVRSGQDKLVSIFGVDELKQGIQEYEKLNGFELTSGQKNAIIHVLNSRDRIIAIQGDAGTGKTTMLDVVRFIAEKKECEIVGLSFTGKAASEIEGASTIKSRTVASLVNSQDNLHGKIVVVDEASMLSIKDTSALLKKCDKDTRVVLVGDTKQLQSIGQGKIFSSLQEKQAISTVRMSEVQRQTNSEYKDVVDNLAAKKVEIALAKLDTKGKIIQIKDQDKIFETITNKYLENHKSTIVVTSTNKDRVELNNRIRNELIQNGNVKDNGREYLTRATKSLIADEKNYAQSYFTGDIVVVNKEGILGKAGTEGRIIGIDSINHMLEVKVKNKNHTIDLKDNGQHLQLYQQENKTFAQGDKILFLKNDRGLEVKNGQTGVIQNIYKDGSLKIKMDNKKELKINPSTQYNYLSHGYALTDYKSQGQTSKHVIYHANTNNSINFNQAYVGITRGKESVYIYTNDKEALFEKVKHAQIKTTTLDYDFKTTQQSVIDKVDKVAQIKDKLTKIANKIPEIKDGFDTANKNEINLVKNSQEKVHAKDDKALLKNHKIDISR